ncbi:hypothetical protein PG995_006012 [Apiospora arundinis]
MRLWESFIQYKGETPSLSKTFVNAKRFWESENPQLAGSMTELRKEQQVLLFLAGQRLAFEMGKTYSDASADWDEEGVVFIEEIRKEIASASTMGPGGPYNLL